MALDQRELANADSPTEVALTPVAPAFQPSAVDWIPVARADAPKADARSA